LLQPRQLLGPSYTAQQFLPDGTKQLCLSCCYYFFQNCHLGLLSSRELMGIAA
jgi:hypothetical protein